MDLKKGRCRSCKTRSSEIYYQSVSDNGYYSLSFKEMFEESIGYPILEHEPQEFCNCCAEKLVEWYEYKYLCRKTQETLVAIKTEPKVESKELVPVSLDCSEDLKPEMSIFLKAPRITEGYPIETLHINPLIKYESKDDSDEHENPEPLQIIEMSKTRNGKSKITFEIYVRSYRDEVGSKKRRITLILTTLPLQTSMHFFRTQLWTQVKKYLIKEVVFTATGEPFWSWTPLPATQDLSKFVEISFENASYSLDDIKYSHLCLWDGKRVNLYVYPYSTSIKTEEQWKKVKENLLTFKVTPEPKKGNVGHKAKKRDKVITETIETYPSTSTNNPMPIQKIKNNSQKSRNVIWYKLKKNQLEVVAKIPIEHQDDSEQHPSLEDHRYTSTGFSSTVKQCCRLEETAEEEDSGERPSKRLKLDQEPTEDYGSIFGDEYDEYDEYEVLEIKKEVDLIEVD